MAITTKDIYVLTIGILPEGYTQTFEQNLFYNSEKEATDHANSVIDCMDPDAPENTIAITDDYGNKLWFNTCMIRVCYVRLSNMARGFEVGLEQSLMQMEAQARGQARAQPESKMSLVSPRQFTPTPLHGQR